MSVSAIPSSRVSLMRALERDQGVGLETLPWATPREAANDLSPAPRTRLRDFRRRMRNAWLEEDPADALASAFQLLDPSSILAIYPGAPPGGPAWIRHTLGSSIMSTAFPNSDKMPTYRLYRLRGRDRFANRPVATAPLVRANLDAEADPFLRIDALLGANSIPQQLRMVLFDARAVALFCGLYRGPGAPRFSDEDHALMLAARPTLQAWMRIARAIGPRPLGDSELTTTLHALSEPALLVAKDRVVFANVAAKALVIPTREWLVAGRPSSFATVASLTPRGQELDLVLPRVARPRASPIDALPPFLRPIGVELARGASDKDIALALDMPLSTVRTYVTRIFTRLGVRGRRELMTNARELDCRFETNLVKRNIARLQN